MSRIRPTNGAMFKKVYDFLSKEGSIVPIAHKNGICYLLQTFSQQQHCLACDLNHLKP